MAYSFNMDRSDVVFASMKDINASFKDLCAVCDAIRYRRVDNAMGVLDDAAAGAMVIKYTRHNRYMGSRHEIGGQKGRFPMKCAAIVRKVLVNAYANAKNKGYDPDSMHVIHASANKTIIAPRAPPKGVRRSVSSGGYGYTTMRTSNLEFARVEIGISNKWEGKLGKNAERLVRFFSDKSGKADEKEAKLSQKAKAVPVKGAPKKAKTEKAASAEKVAIKT